MQDRMHFIITPTIEEKIKEKHGVSVMEVEEAFNQFDGHLIEDTRAQHKTRPPTVWFLAETYDGKLLKLVLIWDVTNARAILKTAYAPDQEEINLYEAYSRRTRRI